MALAAFPLMVVTVVLRPVGTLPLEQGKWWSMLSDAEKPS